MATTAVDAYSGPAQGSMGICIAGINVPLYLLGGVLRVFSKWDPPKWVRAFECCAVIMLCSLSHTITESAMHVC